MSYKILQEQFWQILQPWQRPLFGSLWKACSPNALHNYLLAKKPEIIVSNASVQKTGNNGFVWIIAQNQKQLWHRQGLTPGPEEDMHSGRAEAFGLLAALTFLSHYLSCYDTLPDDTKLVCFCDTSGVITNITSKHDCKIPWPNDTTNNDCDLLLVINEFITKCQPLEIQFLYVKGHQDTKADHPLTSEEEQYNVEYDWLAKTFVQDAPTPSTTSECVFMLACSRPVGISYWPMQVSIKSNTNSYIHI